MSLGSMAKKSTAVVAYRASTTGRGQSDHLPQRQPPAPILCPEERTFGEVLITIRALETPG